MQSDPIIFTDFEYVPPNFKAPPICLFSFCCSSGVYIFKQTESEPNKSKPKSNSNKLEPDSGKSKSKPSSKCKQRQYFNKP